MRERKRREEKASNFFEEEERGKKVTHACQSSMKSPQQTATATGCLATAALRAASDFLGTLWNPETRAPLPSRAEDFLAFLRRHALSPLSIPE